MECQKNIKVFKDIRDFKVLKVVREKSARERGLARVESEADGENEKNRRKMTVIAKLYIYLQRTDIQLFIPIFGGGNLGVYFCKKYAKKWAAEMHQAAI